MRVSDETLGDSALCSVCVEQQILQAQWVVKCSKCRCQYWAINIASHAVVPDPLFDFHGSPIRSLQRCLAYQIGIET